MKRNPKAAFGLFDLGLLPAINRLLKPHGIRLKKKVRYKDWGDQVEITAEPLVTKSQSKTESGDAV